MNLQQLRYIVEVARRDLNVTAAADALYTSQPGVSKQVRLLEEELGIAIFLRQGKRLIGITDAGREVLQIAERMLRDLDNVRNVAKEFAAAEAGVLRLATTHTQARYVLPPVIQQFMRRCPKVSIQLRQGNPTQVCAYVLAGEADLAIATESIAEQQELVTLPCYQWNRCVIAPPKHPILKARPLTLEALAAYPIITYDSAFAGRCQMNKAFVARGLTPNVVLTAIDADVIKTYVALGLGIGIVAKMAYDPKRDRGLRAVDASHLFEAATTYIGMRKNTWLRGYVYTFVELFAPQLTRKMVQAALAGAGTRDPCL